MITEQAEGLQAEGGTEPVSAFGWVRPTGGEAEFNAPTRLGLAMVAVGPAAVRLVVLTVEEGLVDHINGPDSVPDILPHRQPRSENQ